MSNLSSKAIKTIITAGLPYANGDIHVGHVAGAYLPADITNRYFKLKGKETLFICGTDDHGAAIMLAAKEQNKRPEEIVRHFHKRQEEAFKGLNIDFDTFSSTSTNPYHKDLAQEFFLKIYKKGHMNSKVSQQFFDEKENLFLPDRYVKGECTFCGEKQQNSDQCDNCGKLLGPEHLKNPINTTFKNPVTLKDTTHWYLNLNSMQSEVSKWLETSTLREISYNYVKSLISQGLIERSMTRDMSWGIPVPLNLPEAKDKVLYVWFDAPIGYISNTKELLIQKGCSQNEYKKWWSGDSEVYHFIGEDNTIFHCLIWTAMLALHEGFNLPKGVIINKFLNIVRDKEVEKISKSKKNAVWILDYLESNQADYLRYYLTKISPENNRTQFDLEDFKVMCNADLADTLGNFISRSTAFLTKFIGETIPEINQNDLQEIDRQHLQALNQTFKNITKSLDKFSTKEALEQALIFARLCNKYFNDLAPWSSRKTNIKRTELTLAISMQSIYFLGCVLTPIMPIKSQEILDIFNFTLTEWQESLQFPETGSKVIKPKILFPKLL